MSEHSLQQLKSIMEFEGYMGVASEEFKALEAKCILTWTELGAVQRVD